MPKSKVPSSLSDVLKDKNLLKQFEAFCKKEHSTENLSFILIKSWKSENLHRLYFKKGATNELNLPDKLIKEIAELADKKLWDDRRWDEIVKKAKVEITKLLQNDTFPRFVKTL